IKINRGAWATLLLLACGPPAGTPGADAGVPVTARYPVIPNGGGPVLSRSGLVAVTWAGDARAAELDAFVDWLSSSGWLTEAGAEYGVQRVMSAAPVTLRGAPGEVVRVDDVKALIAAAAADGGLPAAAPGAAPLVYLLFLPDGSALLD